MTSIRSLLKNTNLTVLLSALNRLSKTHPLPCYLLKIQNQSVPSSISRAAFLTINRKVSDDILMNHPHKFSVWSPYHLQRLTNLFANQELEDQVILKNLYKSQELIQQSLRIGVREMVIDCVEEYHKIQKVRQQFHYATEKPIKYFWDCQESSNIQTLLQLAENIKGLTFLWENPTSSQKIDSVVRKVLEFGGVIETVLCSVGTQQIEEIKNWSKQPLKYAGRTILKQIEINNFSDLDNYVLATKTLSKRTPIISELAQQLIHGANYHRDCLLVESDRQQWLISKIQRFPLDCQKYIYNMQTAPPEREAHQRQLIAV